MATYWTDFSEYTTSQQPSDWSKPWGPNGEWTVVADAGYTGGKALQYEPSVDDSGTKALKWEEVDGDANSDNVEVLMKYKFPTSVSSATIFAAGRGSGSSGSENVYRAGPRPDVDTEMEQVTKMVNGTTTSLDQNFNTGVVKAVDTYYWTRFRINGSTIQQRTWADGSSEPATWTQEETDTDVTGTGWVGLYRFQSDTSIVDIFSVGTNGDTAPTDEPAQSDLTGTAKILGVATSGITAVFFEADDVELTNFNKLGTDTSDANGEVEYTGAYDDTKHIGVMFYILEFDEADNPTVWAMIEWIYGLDITPPA